MHLSTNTLHTSRLRQFRKYVSFWTGHVVMCDRKLAVAPLFYLFYLLFAKIICRTRWKNKFKEQILRPNLLKMAFIFNIWIREKREQTECVNAALHSQHEVELWVLEEQGCGKNRDRSVQVCWQELYAKQQGKKIVLCFCWPLCSRKIC